MKTFAELVQEDWLAAFKEYSSYGEAPPRLMEWVGVSTLASAMARKVWFSMGDFQWSPCFYILVVAKQGVYRKSSSSDVGLHLLQKVPGVKFGPGSVTWPAFVKYLADSVDNEKSPGARQTVQLSNGQDFEMASTTLSISEFGNFFKVEDNAQIDGLTDFWDARLGKTEKRTKNNGTDIVVNPWINLFAATTPEWISRNWTDDLIGGGLVSRFLFLYGEMPNKDVAYPHKCMPAHRDQMEAQLVERLNEIAQYGGPVDLTPEAYAWGEKWYAEQRSLLRTDGIGSLEAGFLVRKQVHLHKLAMVVCASRGGLPVVTLAHLRDAAEMLASLDVDTRRVFGVVGQTKVTAASREIVEAVARYGKIARGLLFRKQFFRTLEDHEYASAVTAAIKAGLIEETGPRHATILSLKKLS